MRHQKIEVLTCISQNEYHFDKKEIIYKEVYE